MKNLLCLLCLLCSFPVAGSAQSLADAARKERERQKEVQGKVVTFTGTGAATTTTVNTSGTAAEIKPFVQKDNNGRDEKYWKKLFDQARSDLKSAEDRVQLLDSKTNNLNTDLLNRSDIYNKENRVGAAISAAQKDLDSARADVEKAQKRISDLEDELHKAGGPAGWAR
jgi:DNA repair exonuclease SbcCD ATPase subunit